MILSLWAILFQWLDCFLLISCVECNNKFLWIDSSSSFNVFQKAESYLAKVEQQPCMSTKIALSPLMEALVTDQILKHGNCVVKVSAVACISEITRITAPDSPYNDNQMTVLNMPDKKLFFFCFINTQLHAHNFSFHWHTGNFPVDCSIIWELVWYDESLLFQGHFDS